MKKKKIPIIFSLSIFL